MPWACSGLGVSVWPVEGKFVVATGEEWLVGVRDGFWEGGTPVIIQAATIKIETTKIYLRISCSSLLIRVARKRTIGTDEGSL